MATTIQISDETKQLLSSFRVDGRKTYDDVIRALIKRERLVPESMFGTHKELRWDEDRLGFDDD